MFNSLVQEYKWISPLEKGGDKHVPVSGSSENPIVRV